MEKTSPSKKGERKPGSKLSLQKKTRSTKAERNKALGAPATISLVDLNETCEFKDGKSLSMAWGGKGDAESVSGTRIGRLDESLSLVTRKPVSGALIESDTKLSAQLQNLDRCFKVVCRNRDYDIYRNDPKFSDR